MAVTRNMLGEERGGGEFRLSPHSRDEACLHLCFHGKCSRLWGSLPSLPLRSQFWRSDPGHPGI